MQIWLKAKTIDKMKIEDFSGPFWSLRFLRQNNMTVRARTTVQTTPKDEKKNSKLQHCLRYWGRQLWLLVKCSLYMQKLIYYHNYQCSLYLGALLYIGNYSTYTLSAFEFPITDDWIIRLTLINLQQYRINQDGQINHIRNYLINWQVGIFI